MGTVYGVSIATPHRPVSRDNETLFEGFGDAKRHLITLILSGAQDEVEENTATELTYLAEDVNLWSGPTAAVVAGLSHEIREIPVA